jgi:hypothetical protein
VTLLFFEFDPTRPKISKRQSRDSESLLRKKPFLRFRKFHRSRALLVVVAHMIDTTAHRIASHQPSIQGLQQFGNCCGILLSRVEPQVAAVWIEDYEHAAVDC